MVMHQRFEANYPPGIVRNDKGPTRRVCIRLHPHSEFALGVTQHNGAAGTVIGLGEEIRQALGRNCVYIGEARGCRSDQHDTRQEVRFPKNWRVGRRERTTPRTRATAAWPRWRRSGRS